MGNKGDVLHRGETAALQYSKGAEALSPGIVAGPPLS
jgi:hypothetical protein